MSEGQRTAVWQRLCALIGTQAGGDQTDGQLLERYAVHREGAAFAALVRRHGPMVFGLCRRVLRDHHQAEDAFQATFLVLVRKAASLDRRRPLGNWLYTIAYHAALKTRAAGARRVQREAAVARPDEIEPRDEVEATELRQLLDAELHRLPEKYRAPVVLCYLQGRTNEEAAQELGWPSGTVKGRLARARDLLRDRLTRRGLTLSYAVFAAALAEPATAANLPPALAERTVEAASAFGDNIVSATPAAAIAKGVLRAMILTKVKTAALVLTTVLIATGIGFLMLPARAETTPVAAPVPDKSKDAGDAAAKLPEAKGQRLPLDQVKSGNINGDKEERPAVTLGVLEVGKTTEPLDYASAFTQNRLTITSPTAGRPVALMVVSPELDSGEDAKLELLTRDGKVFTLVMSVWQDDAERLRNVPHKKLFINVPLGGLDAGKYEFRFVSQSMFRETAKDRPWYEVKSAKFASVPFTVAKADDTEVGKAVLVKYSDLREPKEKPADLGTFRQFPQPQFHALSPAAKTEIVVARLGLQVGTFDRDKWWASQPKTVGDLPKLREPQAGDPVYATLLSPYLQSMEWMSLRAIEWKDKEAILYVDIWRDQGERTANVLAAHHLVIPLQTPGKMVGGKWQTAPGEYRVKVKWNFLRADNYPTPGQPYWPQDPDKLAAKDPLAALLDHSEANFTMPPADKKAPAPPPAFGDERVSLADLTSMELKSDKRPAITLGLVTDKGDPLQAFANGKLQIEGPRSGLLTLAFAVSPVLNSGEIANVVSLTRDKNVFTLVMDVWRDDSFDRAQNIIHRKAFQVSLGELEGGDYEFRLVQRHLRMDGETKPWYKLKSESAGSVKFHVHEPPETILTTAVPLAEDQLKDVKDAKGLGTYRQYPECDMKRIASELLAGVKEPRVEAGTFDRKAWQNSKPRTVDDLPKLKVPEKGDPVYLTILGPLQNGAEGLTLREIEWKDQEAIVRVDLWHDSGARFDNVIGWTHLTIPLQAPPGDYRVKVEWTFLRAPRYPVSGQTYAVRDPTKFGEKDPFKDFEKRSATKVTIR